MAFEGFGSGLCRRIGALATLRILARSATSNEHQSASNLDREACASEGFKFSG